MKYLALKIFALLVVAWAAVPAALAKEAVTVIQIETDHEVLSKLGELHYRMLDRMILDEQPSKIVAAGLTSKVHGNVILGELVGKCAVKIGNKVYFLEILKDRGIIVFPAKITDGVIKTTGDPVRHVEVEACSSVLLKAIESFSKPKDAEGQPNKP
jgi:hypothetical protein